MKLKANFLFVLIILLTQNPLFSQKRDSSEIGGLWGNAGLGLSSLGASGGNLQLNYQPVRRLLLVAGGGALSKSEGGLWSSGDKLEIKHLDLQIGVIYRFNRSILTITSGPSIVHVTDKKIVGGSGVFTWGGGSNPIYNETIRKVVGLMIQGKYYVAFNKKFGLGGGVHVNINSYSTYIDVTVISIAFGRLQ